MRCCRDGKFVQLFHIAISYMVRLSRQKSRSLTICGVVISVRLVRVSSSCLIHMDSGEELCETSF